jgi:hypothetical protein
MEQKNTKYFYPPRPGNGAGTFSDDIVGLQTVQGGGLTLGNFEFTTSIVEKVNRTFNIGSFSEPISLEDLDINSIDESKRIIESQFKVYPNYDVSQVLNFTMYGSLAKRFSVSVTKIINNFPAGLEVLFTQTNLTTGITAYDISYDIISNETYFKVNVSRIHNPFSIDFSQNSDTNLTYREIDVSRLRNLNKTYLDYVLNLEGVNYSVVGFTPSPSLNSGYLEFYVIGNPFSGNSSSNESYLIRPSDIVSDKVFQENLDEVEKFLTNRLVRPEYTAYFQVPQQNEYGQFYVEYKQATWPKDGEWNLDIRSLRFDNYLEILNSIAENLDSFKTNLISRFLTSASLKEFDTIGQKVEKVFQIYGRSFDQIKEFIDALGYMNSVNYDVGDDIPSQLLYNLSQTLGWSSNFSPITDQDFLSSVFGNKFTPNYPGYSRAETPTEINYQFYRNIILNSAYLFKSKGTRRSVEFMLRLIGAPDALIEFNEHIYLADGKININNFNTQYAQISGGTYVKEVPTYLNTNTFKVKGNTYTAFTSSSIYEDVIIEKNEYPVDNDGYPKAPVNTDEYFFQKGEGWYESTPQHRSNDEVVLNGNVYTGQNFDSQINLMPFTYGQDYLERYRKFPYMTLGYELTKIVDNNKSWLSTDDKLRISTQADYNSYYYVSDEKLTINSKNVDLFLNTGQGLLYDVWTQSKTYGYPIPETGFTIGFPVPGGVDSTFVNPEPQKKTFFEFAQTFWQNMVNTRNRQYISDGKTGGYPNLQSIFWKYIESEETVGIPNNKYTYQKMIDYVNNMNPFWTKLVEQMIPATTLWMTGTKFENSIFHKQKFVYRRQRGCQLVPVPANPCYIVTNVYDYVCNTEYVEFFIFPWLNGDVSVNNFGAILTNRVDSYLNSQGLQVTDCIQNSIRTQWYLDLRISGTPIIQEFIYSGFGPTDVPTNNLWRTALSNNLYRLYDFGFQYFLNGNMLNISSMSCSVDSISQNLSLNVGINININCNNGGI